MSLEIFCLFILSSLDSCMCDKSESRNSPPPNGGPNNSAGPYHSHTKPQPMPLNFTGYSSMSTKSPASTIPKASRSNITNLTVSPDKWDAYPTIERSTVSNCTFTNLTPSSVIERSTLREVTLHSLSRRLVIERSTISGGTLSSAKSVERSELIGCDIGRDASFSRAKCTKSIISNGTSIERTTLKHCLVADSSRIERSELVDCEVVSCRLERTKMQGMLLRNGIWDRNNLVGRIDASQEVVCRPIDHKVDALPQQQPDVVLVPGTAPPASAVLPYEDHSAKSMESDLIGNLVLGLGPSQNARPVAESSSSGEMQAYEGPRVDSPPPPYESLDVDEAVVAESSGTEGKRKI